MPHKSDETKETTYVRLRSASDKREYAALVHRHFRIERGWLFGTRKVDCTPRRAVLVGGDELEPSPRRGEYFWHEASLVLREMPEWARIRGQTAYGVTIVIRQRLRPSRTHLESVA